MFNLTINYNILKKEYPLFKDKNMQSLLLTVYCRRDETYTNCDSYHIVTYNRHQIKLIDTNNENTVIVKWNSPSIEKYYFGWNIHAHE